MTPQQPLVTQQAAALPRSFAVLMSAQFVSALADNAVLIVAIAMLEARGSQPWLAPVLKLLFTVSYVVFACWVGRIADAYPKARVMMLTNGIKAAGCVLLLTGTHPLAAYALIGLGAAAYSPAKYGLMVQTLPVQQLIRGNAWLEGLTIASVIAGTLMGGALVSREFAAFAAPGGGSVINTEHVLHIAAMVVLGMYAFAALINLWLPMSMPESRDTSAPLNHPVSHFVQSLQLLAADPLGRISLAVTTLLWGVGAAMQFVALDWGREALSLTLDRASILQGVVAVGVAIGAFIAAKRVSLHAAPRILPLGIAIGPVLLLLLPVEQVWPAALLLAGVGAMAGFFVVPMNALLQHRGFELAGSGQSIAVQNFCENLSVIAMLASYAGMRGSGVPLVWIVAIFALGTALAMAVIVLWYRTHHEVSTDKHSDNNQNGLYTPLSNEE
jgi:MFS family permease